MKGISKVRICLRCDDMSHIIAKLHTAGVKSLSKIKVRDGGEEVASFADPNGHIITVARPVKK